MVQLNTTYDSSIHQKVFVLKGDEAYARTTDTIATLITDFGDFDNHISYCHVGLEIQVLRELGDSHLLITIDGESLEPIPWSDSGMGEIIDSDWNEKGVYWENGKLLIGKYSLNPLVNTGLYLLYDVEHKIEVRYEPNNYCLGSSAKPIVFTVPTPDVFTSTLTLNPLTTRFAPDDEVDMKLSFDCDNQTTTAKSVRIYDNDVLVETVEVTQDIFTMLELGVLSTGLHTIKAVFEGDDEAYASETSLDISVGYKITNLQYPPSLFSGETGSVSCNVLDYFNESWSGLNVKLSKWTNNEWIDISDSSTTDSNGYVGINNAQITADQYAIKIGDWYGNKLTTTVISIATLNVAFNDSIVDRPLLNNNTWDVADSTLTATVLDNYNQPVGYIPLTIEVTTPFGEETFSGMTNENGMDRWTLGNDYAGIMTATVSVNNTQLSDSASLIIPEYWWNLNRNKQVGSYTKDSNISISKVSNGYKLNSNSSSVNLVKFPYNPNSGTGETMPIAGEYKIEFDVVSISGSGNGYLCGRPYEFQVAHYTVYQNLDNNGVLVEINNSGRYSGWGYNSKWFEIGGSNYQMVIDNLVIVRAE